MSKDLGGRKVATGWLNARQSYSAMKMVPLGEAKDKLSVLVDEVEMTHEIITITRHGRPAAVLMSSDDLESLHETLYWLSKPGTRESIAAAEREYTTDNTTGSPDVRAEFGLPAG